MSTDTSARQAARPPEVEDEPVFLAVDESEDRFDPSVIDTSVAASREATLRRPPNSSSDEGEIVFAGADAELLGESPADEAGVAERPAWLPPKGRPAAAAVAAPVAVNGARSATSAQSTAKPRPSPGASKRPAKGRAKNGIDLQLPLATTKEPEEDLPWQNQLKRWLIGFTAMGYGMSLMVHLGAVLGLSLIVSAPRLLNRPASLTASQSEGIDTGIEGDGMGEAQEAGGAPNAPSMIETAQVQVALDALNDQSTVMEPEFPADLLNAGEAGGKPGASGGKGNGTGGGVGNGTALFTTKPGGGKAVTKGRFSAWTKPEDPLPGQPYRIYIQIELPPKIARLPKGDLEGSNMIGTDRFQINIADDLKNRSPGTRLRANGKQVQIEVFVPGAAANVKDTIFIKSKLLNEEQTIELVF